MNPDQPLADWELQLIGAQVCPDCVPHDDGSYTCDPTRPRCPYPPPVRDLGGVTLHAQSLLSKWGFNDGDVPEGYLDWLDEHGLPYPDDWHGLLRLMVRTRLMPHIREDVQLVSISTIHNPIRARTVNGREIDDTADNDHLLIDTAVSVPFADVYDLQTSGVTA